MISADDYKKAKEGDLKAIENICVVTWEPLYRFIYYKVQNREEAEDITRLDPPIMENIRVSQALL